MNNIDCDDAFCPAHNRVNQEFSVAGGMVSGAQYVGNYLILTALNQKYLNPTYAGMAAILLGAGRTVPKLWETAVYDVGTGSLADIADEGGKIMALQILHSETEEGARKNHETSVGWARDLQNLV